MPEIPPVSAEMLSNAAWHELRTELPLSIVVPFFNYDVSALATRLLLLARRAGVPVPLIFVDDGSPHAECHHRLWAVLSEAEQPCLLAVLHKNVGRAKVRNYLCQLARTPYLLYLDADMWPDREDFLQQYLTWVTAGGVDVIYGGRSADKVVVDGPDYELHRLMTVQREALPAAVRRKCPAYHFYSCNFVVRREILAHVPLDERFTGWGWEDCEWASRVARSYDIRHEDNSASHLGLLNAKQLLKKYDESVVNFKLMLDRRPDLLTPTPLFRVSRLIGRLKLAPIVAYLSRRLAVSRTLPVALRMYGLMFYKASLYANLSKQVVS